jgi:GDP-L-fucose synthase
MVRYFVHVMNFEMATCQHTEPIFIHMNVNTGKYLFIKELAETIKAVVSYTGTIEFDPRIFSSSKKLMDSLYLNSLRWKPEVGLKDGLVKANPYFNKTL